MFSPSACLFSVKCYYQWVLYRKIFFILICISSPFVRCSTLNLVWESPSSFVWHWRRWMPCLAVRRVSIKEIFNWISVLRGTAWVSKQIPPGHPWPSVFMSMIQSLSLMVSIYQGSSRRWDLPSQRTDDSRPRDTFFLEHPSHLREREDRKSLFHLYTPCEMHF